LQQVLEIWFDLMYNRVISRSEIENTPLKEISWFHNKLANQKKHEIDAMKGSSSNG